MNCVVLCKDDKQITKPVFVNKARLFELRKEKYFMCKKIDNKITYFFFNKWLNNTSQHLLHFY